MSTLILLLTVFAAGPLGRGDHFRTLEVDGQVRSYLVHVPTECDAQKATPVVLVFHGALTNAPIMRLLCQMDRKADEAGFVVVYPNGTGKGLLLAWNAGGRVGGKRDANPDDVKFVEGLLDDLATVVNVDPRRVYATGHSSGGMMCYRLAAELPERIAAIAPVSATMAVDCAPKLPVPVMHFHGTADKRVPFDEPGNQRLSSAGLRSVAETVGIWVRVNRCHRKPTTADLPDKADDGTSVKRIRYGAGKRRAEVVLFVIKGGGHTWPGNDPLAPISGKSSKDISANDLMWKFFERHPKKP